MGGVFPPPHRPHRLAGAALPTGVLDLEEPPDRLFLTGVMPPGPRVAIVGTRRPTPEAYRFTLELALQLTRAGVVVVSGGALGIDTAAHEGALHAGGGTLVVAPASFECPYPEENAELFQQIVRAGGGYLTFFDQPTVARRHAFFARNALMVSLCTSVIMVQAPYRSGARNALLWARRLARPYWVVPHAPWCSQGASSVAEMRLGGRPLASAKDLLTWLSAHGHNGIPLDVGLERSVAEPPALASGREPVRDDDTRRGPGPLYATGEVTERVAGRDAGPHRDICRLVAQVKSGPKHLDELCVSLGWDAGRLHATVLHATLMGEVMRTGSGHVVVAPQQR
jgi:DNA processing protein